MGNLWTYLEIKRSKIKVTRRINVISAPYAGRGITIKFRKISLLIYLFNMNSYTKYPKKMKEKIIKVNIKQTNTNMEWKK